MNPIKVTIGPSHTMRDAARRMVDGGVGSAVVFDPELPGPGIVTERDILEVVGTGGDLDSTLVSEHLTSQLVFAEPDWSLDRAAEAMTRGHFRHIIVIEDGEVVGMLSMRDVVRCMVQAGQRISAPGG